MERNTPTCFYVWLRKTGRRFRHGRKDSRSQSASGDVSAGRTAFESLSCVNCHVVKGTRAIGKFGPDLTHLASRSTIAAGVMTNTPEHLKAWINDPQQIKPGCLMPSMKLGGKELDQLVSYLETLK